MPCKIFIPILIMTVVISGCTKKPEACIKYEDIIREVGNNVTFHNCSENAELYTWRFGDGTIFENASASRSYNTTGDFKVELIAYSKHYQHTSKATVMVKVRERKLTKIKINKIPPTDNPWNISNTFDLVFSINNYEYRYNDFNFNQLPLEKDIAYRNIRASRENPVFSVNYIYENFTTPIVDTRIRMSEAKESPFLYVNNEVEIEFHYEWAL